MEEDENHVPSLPARRRECLMATAARIFTCGTISVPAQGSSGIRPRLPLHARPPAFDGDGGAAIPAANDGKILGQDNHPQRNHPEAEDGQESKHAADDEQDAEPDADYPAARKTHTFVAETEPGQTDDLSRHNGGWPPTIRLDMGELPVVGKRLSSEIGFPDPLQARQAFAIGHRARRNVPIPGSSVGRASGC
jgi:hypothetical protein